MLHRNDVFQVILKLLPTVEVKSRIHGLVGTNRRKKGKGKEKCYLNYRGFVQSQNIELASIDIKNICFH